MRTPHERPDQAYRTDLALAENCRGIVARTVDDLGGLDILVNNVAYQNPVDDFTDLTEEQWRRTFAVNIDSYFHTAHAAVDHLGDGGCIINTSSVDGLRSCSAANLTRRRSTRPLAIRRKAARSLLAQEAQ